MSIVLPNGNTLHLTTIEQLRAVAEKIDKGEPVVVRAEVDGIVEETVVWEPEANGELPAGASRPGSPARA